MRLGHRDPHPFTPQPAVRPSKATRPTAPPVPAPIAEEINDDADYTVYLGGRSDITNAATSFGEVSLKPSRWCFGHDGELVHLTVFIDGDVGGSGKDYAGELYINRWDGSAYTSWVATGITCTISGGSGTEQVADDFGAGVDFGARDLVAAYDKRTGTPNAQTSWFFVGVRVRRGGDE